MSQGLKTTFLVHAIVALVFAIVLYFKPAIWATAVNWRPFDWNMTRVLAAALFALAVGSWLGYRATRWEEVRIVVLMEIVFTVLAAIAGLYGVLFVHAPAFTWLAIVIWVVFAAAFAFFYRLARA